MLAVVTLRAFSFYCFTFNENFYFHTDADSAFNTEQLHS